MMILSLSHWFKWKDHVDFNFQKTLNPRYNWVPRAGREYKILVDQPHESVYVHGRWKTVKSAQHEFSLPCYAYIRSGNLYATIGTCHRVWKSTDIYGFAIDDFGVKMFLKSSPKDDFHFSTDPLLLGDVEFVYKLLLENRTHRLKTEAQRTAIEAESAGVYVCLADSLSAGNCLEGTRQFAIRNSLNLKSHYLATDLLKVNTNDFGRLRLTISAAIHRHKRELERGYALLSEHKVSISN